MPLQARIRETRSFQTMSPVRMLEETLAQSNGAPVVAGLKPGKGYDADDRAALKALEACHGNFSVVEGGMDRLLPAASLVVTQNSTVALMGFFLHKPAVLFGQIDFHHIAANVSALGVAQAFAATRRTMPDFERYLFWFFRHMAIDAAASDAEAQIVESMERCGWRA